MTRNAGCMSSSNLVPYRLLIESALVYAGGTYTYDDVVREVEAGQAQFWPGPASCIVTQLDEQPGRTILQFFLAAGNAAELQVMEREVAQWGREQGCTLARMAGRKGWLRSWVMEQGWQDTNLVILEKQL